MLESVFKSNLIRELSAWFPGCIVLHTNPNDIEDFPDLLILYNDKWAALEVKQHQNAKVGPNQPYYVNLLNEMSYASFVYPENLNKVLDELQFTFQI